MRDRSIDEQFMSLAIAEATDAMHHHDVPVGAVLVDDMTGEVLARAHNQREVTHNALDHAEMRVIDEACRKRGDWRLRACTLYVTLEPCPMCAGSILHARIPRVVYGASDPVAGAMGSVWALHRYPVQNQHTTVDGGCCQDECKDILQDFFKRRRNDPRTCEKE